MNTIFITSTLYELFGFVGFFLIGIIFKFLGLVIPLLLAVAYSTLLERKVLSAFHRRRGPNMVGIWGLLQPLADGLKLFAKETTLPSQANRVVFLCAPIITFFLSLVTWVVIPFEKGVVYADLSIGIMFLLAISSLSVYGIIMAGWSSNSKYPFLGALRSAAQMVSYEVSVGLLILTVVLCVGSLNLTKVVLMQKFCWYVFPLWPSFLMFYVSGLAETNRPPFDLPEAEAELVSGYNVEYSGMGFALFFLGEYAHMILMSTLLSLLFFGGWLFPGLDGNYQASYSMFILAVKVVLFFFSFLWVRATFPRYRYDQLMRLGWKVFLPLSLGWLILVASIIFCLHRYCSYILFFSEIFLYNIL